VSSRCAECTALQRDLGEGKGTHARAIEENAAAFTPPERITDALHHGGTENLVLPTNSHYPIPIPYELCSLTKYHG
jgi:hypothetical protein